MRKFLIILAVLIAALLAASFVKNTIIGASIEKGVELVTGLKLKIGSINVGILRSIIDIRNIRLANPAGYPDRIMMDMPEIYVDYDLPAIFGGKVHLREMRLALKELVVVKNKNGELNLNALRMVQAEKAGKSPYQTAPGKPPEIRIDRLKLNIGKAIYKDYSRGGEPYVREFNVNLNESYSDVDNPYTLASLIVVKALANTSISGLANFDLNGLQGTLGDTLASAQKTVAATRETAKQTVKAAAETAKKAQDIAEQATGIVKDVFSNPFGSGK